LRTVITERSTAGTQVWSSGSLAETFDLTTTAVGQTSDGSRYALGSSDGSVRMLSADLRTVRWRRQVFGPKEMVRGVVLSGNSNVMAVQAEDTRVHLRDFAGRSRNRRRRAPNAADRTRVVRGDEVSVFSPRTSPSPATTFRTDAGILRVIYDVFNRLVLLHDDGSIEVAGGDGRGRKVISILSYGQSTNAVVSEDTRTVAFADDNTQMIYVKRVDTPEPLMLYAPHRLVAMSFSRDGSRLATLDRIGTVRVYNTVPQLLKSP
jgi:WD40 repeat protein